MAITVPGSGSSATTSVTIPAHAVGDMIVIMARGTVAPTAPAAGGTVPTWTTPTNQTGLNNSIGWRLGYAIATATNHTSGTWTSAAQMHVLILRRTGSNTLGIGNDPVQGGANNTQTMIYPAFTLTAGKVSNLVIRYGARGVADTEVRTDGAFAASGVWHTEQPATTPTSAVFSKVVTASEGTFTATPAGSNAAYRCGTVEITETAAAVNWSQPEDEAPTVTDAQAKSVTSPQADAIAGVDIQAVSVTSPQADAATVTDAIDPQLTVGEFSPADIAGLECWLKADAIGLADGANVTTWEDSHTSNKDATGASGQTLQTNEIEGLPVVRFDGVDDRLSVVGLTPNDATRTLFIVARAIGSLTVEDSFVGWLTNAGVAMNASGVMRYNHNQAGTVVNFGATGVQIGTVRWNSTSSCDVYLNAGSATNFDPNDAYQAGTAHNLQLGARNAANYGNVEIGEVLVYDSALADADLDDVRDYLISRWTAAPVEHDQPVDDSITGTDAQTKTVASTKAEAAAGTDAQAKSITAPKADAFAGTDAISKAPRHPIADAVAGTDAQTRQATKAQVDAIAGTDARAIAVTRSQADSGTVTDATARVWAAKLAVADGISVTDDIDTSAAGATEESVDDSVAVTDAITVSLGSRRTIGDSLVATDALASQADYVRQPADALTAGDVLARAWVIFEAQDDALAVTDAVNARIPPSRWLPDTDEDWPADTDSDWEAQTDDRWLVSAESKW